MRNNWNNVTSWNNAGGIADLQNQLNSGNSQFNQSIPDYTSTDNSGGSSLTMNDITTPSDGVLASLSNSWDKLKNTVNNEIMPNSQPITNGGYTASELPYGTGGLAPKGVGTPLRNTVNSNTYIAGIGLFACIAVAGFVIIRIMKKGKK